MEKLFHVAEEYIKGMKWQDMALLKICLCAAGIIIGITAPKRWRKGLLALAAAAFVITYIPLMAKFVPAMRNLGCCGAEADFEKRHILPLHPFNIFFCHMK